MIKSSLLTDHIHAFHSCFAESDCTRQSCKRATGRSLRCHFSTNHLQLNAHRLFHAHVIYFLLLAFSSATANAQVDTSLVEPQTIEMLEEAAEGTLSEEISDNTAFEQLDFFRQNKLDINNVDAASLSQLIFLTPLQIENILAYRQEMGPFISIYELQAVPSLDISTIKLMLPFVELTNEAGLTKSIKQLFTLRGDHMLIARWSSQLERSSGYNPPTEAGRSYYLGDPNRYYLRYRYSIGRSFTAGLTAEKDAGEPFFTEGNKQGFDFYSAHLEWKRSVDKGMTHIAIGDFEVNFGQGLIQYHGFSTGKSALTTSVKRVAPVFKAHTSVNEIEYYRGLAIGYRLNPALTINTFASRKKRDANVVEPTDSLIAEEFPDISSLQTSGLHRTTSELADKNSTTQTTLGMRLNYRNKKLQIALNGVHHRLSNPLQPREALYNRYYFKGTNLTNLSTSYSWTYKNAHFFGELATSDFGALASLNGLLLSLGKGIETAFVYRNYPKEFASFSTRVFGESRTPGNESGLYFGTSIRLAPRWKLNLYNDTWQNEWPRFSNDAPAKGNETLLRLTYEERRRLLIYLQVKRERKASNVQSELNTSPTLPRETLQTRLHTSYKLSDGLELRTRLDWGKTTQGSESLKGISIYQDFIYRQMGSPWSFAARYAIFDTEDYDIRFYHYENDVLYSFSIPAYFNAGIRYYLKVRYKIRRGPQIEMRFARSTFPRLERIGSSLDEIEGNTKSELKCQLFWKF